MSRPVPLPLESGDEFELPCVEAILAGTLALMTGHAQACCAAQRQRMAAKILSNMGLLAAHPQLSPAFRTAIGQLHAHWERLQAPGGMPAGDGPSWHPAPDTVQ